MRQWPASPACVCYSVQQVRHGLLRVCGGKICSLSLLRHKQTVPVGGSALEQGPGLRGQWVWPHGIAARQQGCRHPHRMSHLEGAIRQAMEFRGDRFTPAGRM